MNKEYKDSIREGFEVYIAKQLKLEAISKEVLAVQVFAMNENGEYKDKKLQAKWGEWNVACRLQIEKDAEIVGRRYILNGHAPTGIFKDICIVAIINQLKA